MNDPELRYQTMLAKIRERGCRLTSQRLALLRILAEAEAHPNAMQLYERMLPQFPTVSLATIYKTLNLLLEEGEVLAVDGQRDRHYDGNRPASHPHLVCIRCNRVMDGDDALVLRDLEQRILARYNFTVQRQNLVFYGICSGCREKGSQSTQAPTQQSGC